MTVVNVVTGEILDEHGDLTAEEARSLTDRIRQTLTISHDLITTAYKGRAWVALGYQSWDAYCAGEFAEARMIRLDREQRREIVAEMRQAGMSQTAIASGLGVSPSTIALDSTAIRHNHPDVEELPERVIGLDGRSRPATRPADATRPASPTPGVKRRPLIDVATDATYDLVKVAERLERITADDRFPTNAEQIAAKNRGDLLRAAEALARVLDRL